MTVIQDLLQSPFNGSPHAHLLQETKPEKYFFEELVYKRYYLPYRPCFVCKRDPHETRHHLYRVDKLYINRGKFSFFVTCVANTDAPMKEETEIAPLELTTFRSSGKWCVGNDAIDQILKEYEKEDIEKVIARSEQLLCFRRLEKDLHNLEFYDKDGHLIEANMDDRAMPALVNAVKSICRSRIRDIENKIYYESKIKELL